jgi:hypothetical protein
VLNLKTIPFGLLQAQKDYEKGWSFRAKCIVPKIKQKKKLNLHKSVDRLVNAVI